MSTVSDAIDPRPHQAGEPTGTVGWRHRFAVVHAAAAAGLLLVLSALWVLLEPHAAASMGAGAALIGGALIGVPHGSSDFVVAHRLFGPSLGRSWFPAFVLAYLALVLGVLGVWRVLPFATLLTFLLISALHFGAEDLHALNLTPSWWRRVARASTPLVPIIILHLSEVAPFFAAMSGREPSIIVTTIEPVRPALLVAWIVIVAATVLTDLGAAATSRVRAIEGCEIFALGVAAVLLPPLVTFTMYFCLIHAVRHMMALTAQVHPHRTDHALRLAAMIIGPSAVACLLVLAASWSAISGVMATDALLCLALQIVAALTVPHMLLEVLGDWLGRFPR